MQVHTERAYLINLTEKEYELLYMGIGNTSPTSRKEAGMTEEQAEFFYEFYSKLHEAQI